MQNICRAYDLTRLQEFVDITIAKDRSVSSIRHIKYIFTSNLYDGLDTVTELLYIVIR